MEPRHLARRHVAAHISVSDVISDHSGGSEPVNSFSLSSLRAQVTSETLAPLPPVESYCNACTRLGNAGWVTHKTASLFRADSSDMSGPVCPLFPSVSLPRFLQAMAASAGLVKWSASQHASGELGSG